MVDGPEDKLGYYTPSPFKREFGFGRAKQSTLVQSERDQKVLRSQLMLGKKSDPFTQAKGNHLELPVFGRDLSKMESPSHGRISIEGTQANDHNSYFGLR